ncbi:rhamnosyl/mannosyltransferase [Sphingobacterium yanglingense]|uniref:Rhamnosyl/mannosyltransferase n=2 Tax=Sphingobacterium yanglingense TaxID=1437280 RepID=A0A4R6WHK6_9SPHI|nr:rhamnosyl/mannosyltransferase [Sphingobacterium yanglingense]
MNSMKILQVGKFYPIRGGVEKVMYDLTLGLSNEEVYCDMLCASTEGYPQGVTQLNDFARLIVVKTQLKLAATMLAPAMISTLRRIAKDYDIIHVHHPDPMAALALYCSGYKGKVIMHWHSDILNQKKLMKLYAPLQSWLIRRADLIVGTTPVYVKDSTFLRNVQGKCDYVPIGIEPFALQSDKAEAIKQQFKGKKIIFSLGRLVPYKGYEYLVRAAALLTTDVQIVIGGTGPLMDELKALAEELGVKDKVTFLGFVSDEDVPAYYEACDCFCLSSVWKNEAFAIVQLEAMSLGKPVISTAIPGSGVSWVNQHLKSGIVVPVADEVALSAGINKLLSNDLLYSELSEGSRARYEQLFRREKMVSKTNEIYCKLLLQNNV